MTIGKKRWIPGEPVEGLLIRELPADVLAYDSLEAALAGGDEWQQGTRQAVAPMGDDVTGRLAPPISGGLQMQKRIIVLPGQPVPLPGVIASAPIPPPAGDLLTDGAGNYLTNGAGDRLAT